MKSKGATGTVQAQQQGTTAVKGSRMHLHGDECVLASIPATPSSMDPRAEATAEARFS
jgi:hypothetical protein